MRRKLVRSCRNLQEIMLEHSIEDMDIKGICLRIDISHVWLKRMNIFYRQAELTEAVMLAAAGGHNMLMIGEPGCGKTMVAQRIPTILPQMTEEECLEVTKIYSISGILENGHSLIKNRPFRAPHHNASLNALIGGGVNALPGEVSLAHNGVLFLDELAEFSRRNIRCVKTAN